MSVVYRTVVYFDKSNIWSSMKQNKIYTMSTFNQCAAEGLIIQLQKEAKPFLEKNQVKFFSPRLFEIFFRTDIESFFTNEVVQKNTDLFVGQVLFSDRASFVHMKEYSKSVIAAKEVYGVLKKDEDLYNLHRKDFHNSFVSLTHKLDTVNNVLSLLLEEGQTTVGVNENSRIGDKVFRSIFSKNKKHNEIQKKLQEEFYKMHLCKHFFPYIASQKV